MAPCVRVHSGHQSELPLLIVNSIKVASLEKGVKDERRVIDNHPLMPNFTKLKIRIVFLEKPLQELRFAQMKLIERIIFALFVEFSMDVEAIGWPVSHVNEGRFWDR